MISQFAVSGINLVSEEPSHQLILPINYSYVQLHPISHVQPFPSNILPLALCSASRLSFIQRECAVNVLK